MKTLLFSAVCLLGLTGSVMAQQVTLRIDAGKLENATGTAVVPDGMLLQLIASPSGTFSAPTSGSYITGDNVLLGNFAMNSNSGIAGETLNNTTLTLATYNLVANEKVLLRFFPNLSYTSIPTTPTLGTTYGQVRSDTIESGLTDGSQAPWIIPSTSGAVDLLYITVNDGGTYSNLSAQATNTVLAVPEPSTGILSGLGMMMLVGGARIWRRLRAA